MNYGVVPGSLAHMQLNPRIGLGLAAIPVFFLALMISGCGETVAPIPERTVVAPPVASPIPAVGAARSFVAKHVVVIVMDGPRWSETWGEPTRKYIPHMATELAPLGALWTDFANDCATQTTAGHTAITTGFYQNINNKGEALPARPSIFQRLVKARGGVAEVAWIISSKDKLAVLSDTTDPAWTGQWQCRSDCGIDGRGVTGGYRDDAQTWERVQIILPRDHPSLVLINLREPDSSGHGKDWPGYLRGIREGDLIIKQLWDLIQADPVYRNTTDLFVTNDHGRHPDGHKDGFVSHGDDCFGCRKISLLAIGPDIPAGAVFTQHRSLIDLGVTVAKILGVEHEGSQGKILDEVLTAPKP